jgi:hypothetical protein
MVPPPTKLTYNEDALRIQAEGLKVDVAWLANRSKVDPALVDSDEFLRAIFRRGEKVVVFADDRSQGVVWPDAPLPKPGPRGMWYLIQPVDGVARMNPRTGKLSRRSEESVTAWRYLLMESDEAPAGLWLAALMNHRLPLAAIYTSGGRSIHAIWKVDAEGIQQWRDLVDPLKRCFGLIGIDTKAMTPVRLSRLPGQPRSDRAGFQRLLYLNPFPLAERVSEQPVLRNVEQDWVVEAREAWKSSDVARMQRALTALRFYGRATPKMASAADDLEACLKTLVDEGQV